MTKAVEQDLGAFQEIIPSKLKSICEILTETITMVEGIFQILGPVLFSICINNLDLSLKGILSEFDDNTKLGGAVGSLESREALQRSQKIREMGNHQQYGD